MVKVPYWVQRADYTSTDHEAVDAEGAIRAAQSHDWRQERQLQDERDAVGLETCPPGIGFVDSENRILHICPGSDGTAVVHYHVRRSRVQSGAGPVLIRLGIVILGGAIGWHFLGGWPDLAAGSFAAVTGLFAVLVFWDADRRMRSGLPVRFEPVVLTREAVPMADVPEFIRRFFESDHAWLAEQAGGRSQR